MDRTYSLMALSWYGSYLLDESNETWSDHAYNSLCWFAVLFIFLVYYVKLYVCYFDFQAGEK